MESRCERCGYSTADLPTDGDCPECGFPIARSLPNTRPGSPWQQEPSVRSWLVTVWHVCCRPRRTLRQVSYRESTPLPGLFFCNALVPPFVVLLGLGYWVVIMELLRPSSEDSFSLGFIYTVMALSALGALAMWFAITALALGCAAILIRVLPARAPIARQGTGAIVIHASCVLAPMGGILVASSFLLWSDSFPAVLAWLAALGCCFVWFGAVCLSGLHPARVPDDLSQ